jgi:molybdenum cofactor cytidylyltransferase
VTEARVGVIVLAAGRSTRFGSPGAHKLLAVLDDEPLVRRSVRAAVDAAVGEVVVVTGAQATDVERALAGLPIRIVNEPRFAAGMAMSLRRGVSAVEGDVGAVMISLGDQPGMRADAYRRVVSRWRASNSAIIIPRYAGASSPAHPTLFASECFGELLALDGDSGARSVVTRDPARVAEAYLEWPAPRDVDTREDFELLRAELAQLHGSTDCSSVPVPPPLPNTAQ